MQNEYRPIGPDLCPFATGVVRPVVGQNTEFAGPKACGSFATLLINALTPIRYGKGAIKSVALAPSIKTARQTVTVFSTTQGDPGSVAGFPAGYVLSVGDTNYTVDEAPVPQNGGWLFCVVGVTASVERVWRDLGDGKRAYPPYISQAVDYRETLREELIDNTTLLLKYGNTGSSYQLGLLKQFPASNEVHGGDKLATGVMAMPLQFTPLNAVVCIDSIRNAQSARIDVTYNPVESTLDEGTLPLPVAAEDLYSPVEISLYGFVVQNAASILMAQLSDAACRANAPAGGLYR